jgi:hypothetical protein
MPAADAGELSTADPTDADLLMLAARPTAKAISL